MLFILEEGGFSILPAKLIVCVCQSYVWWLDSNSLCTSALFHFKIRAILGPDTLNCTLYVHCVAWSSQYEKGWTPLWNKSQNEYRWRLVRTSHNKLISPACWQWWFNTHDLQAFLTKSSPFHMISFHQRKLLFCQSSYTSLTTGPKVGVVSWPLQPTL